MSSVERDSGLIVGTIGAQVNGPSRGVRTSTNRGLIDAVEERQL